MTTTFPVDRGSSTQGSGPATEPELTAQEAERHARQFERTAAEIDTAILGKHDVVRLSLVALLARGHILLEDVPGLGKTTLARAVAASVDGSWRRIQFTPDLLPSDVSGVPVFNQATREFEFHPGPVFANVVIADEINRASPKTQSALLEVMEEHQVTVDGVRYAVPDPFLVVATQNPVEMDGTYRLPEAQLDRFLMRLSLGYPDSDAELSLMRGGRHRSPEELNPVIDTEQMGELARAAERMHVPEQVYDYVLRLAQATRDHAEIRVGLSTRATVVFMRAVRIYALSQGRCFVTPEDVKELAVAVWAHRLVRSTDSVVNDRSLPELMREVLDREPTPGPTLDET